MSSPVVTATFSKTVYAPGELMVLTVDHTDVDRATITVSGEVTDTTGAKGSWSAQVLVDEGTVAITAAGGKTWAVQSASRNQTVFTANA